MYVCVCVYCVYCQLCVLCVVVKRSLPSTYTLAEVLFTEMSLLALSW